MSNRFFVRSVGRISTQGLRSEWAVWLALFTTEHGVMRKLWGKSPHASRTRRRFTMSPSAKRLLSKLVNSSKVYVTSIRRKSTVPIVAPELTLKLQSRLARRDWWGWPAQTATARGSIRTCLRKSVDDWISPLASRASDEATGPLPCELSLRAAELQPIWL